MKIGVTGIGWFVNGLDNGGNEEVIKPKACEVRNTVINYNVFTNGRVLIVSEVGGTAKVGGSVGISSTRAASSSLLLTQH